MRALYLIAFALLLCGCSNYEMIRERNKENMAKVSMGDSKTRVVELCGTPDKNEQFIKAESGYDVIFYYTDQIGDKSWETGHTPILLKDGKVIGIGWRALKVNGIESSDISIETRSR